MNAKEIVLALEGLKDLTNDHGKAQIDSLKGHVLRLGESVPAVPDVGQSAVAVDPVVEVKEETEKESKVDLEPELKVKKPGKKVVRRKGIPWHQVNE